MFHRILASFVVVLTLTTAAAADRWTVLQTANRAFISTDGATWLPLRAGQEWPSGAWLRTGPRGRAILAKGRERIVYRANSLAALSQSKSGKKSKVTHRRGSLLLSVETRRRKHTSVVTPHLAAVVKGTIFEVTVSARQSRVRVDQGVVSVTNDSGSIDVATGRIAASSGAAIEVSLAEVTSVVPGRSNAIGLGLQTIATVGGGTGNSGGNGQSGNNGRGIGLGIGGGLGGGVGGGIGGGVGGGNGGGIGGGVGGGLGGGVSGGIGGGVGGGLGGALGN